ncbi:MAG: VCBS domain-containing protein, partial [Desulfuromusa sp.]|nr:VCBS domain-containing protein [Desulfuromusa sp.]
LTVDTTGGVTEDATTPNLTDSGVLSFTDIDTTDTHSVSTSYNSDAVWSDGILNAAQITAISSGFSADSDSWDYSVANADLQFLDAGETIILSFDVTVSDDSGATNDSDTQTVTLTLTGTNDAPVFDSTPVSAAAEDATYSYTVTTSDIDIEAVTITATTLPSWLTLTDNGDGTATLSGTPLNADVGPHAVILNVSDGSLSSDQSFTIVVVNTNDAPEGTVTINNMSPTEGDTLTASNNLTDEDGLSGVINYQWQRSGVDILGATGNTYTTTRGDTGHVIRVVASFIDDRGTTEHVISSETTIVYERDNDGLIDSSQDDDTSNSGTDDNSDTGQSSGDSTEETPLTDDLLTPQPDEPLTLSEIDESLVLAAEQDTEGILYLTDENDSDNESSGRGENNDLLFFDHNLYKEISAANHLNYHFGINKGNFDTNDFSVDDINFEDNELQRIIDNGAYDQLRDEIDEAFSAEQHSESVRTNIITATTATFTIGLVSYLLRAGSLIASMMSTLPLWRGFDPIVIVAGKKKKKDKKKVEDPAVTESETLFDSESE